MIGAFEIRDSLFDISYPVKRPLQERAGASHIDVNSAEQESSGMIADQLGGLLQIFETVFVEPFMNVRQSQAKVSLSESSPVARLPIAFQGALRIVPGNIVFRDPPIHSREPRVNRTDFRSLLGYLTQRRF